MHAKHPSVLLLGVLLVASGASGCLGDGDGPEAPAPARQNDPDPYVPTTGGEKRASTLTVNDSVEAPKWRVGDWFGHHMYYQGGPREGRHYNTVVVAADDEGWTLAPDDPEAAKEERAWDLPVAGRVAPDLSTTAYGAAWDLFRFPLSDGKSWQGTVEARDLEQYALQRFDVTFVVAFDAAIEVNGASLPGFRVSAQDSDGTTVVDASYIPAIRWYGHITLHDPRTEDPEDFFLKTVSMGYGTGWTGTYHVATGDLAIEHFGGFVVFEPGAIGPRAPETFPVAEGTNSLFGIVFAVAYAGAGTVALVDPDGTVHEAHAVHPAGGGTEEPAVDVQMWDEPAAPGDWAIASAGGGAVWVAGAYLFALTMEEGTL